MSSAAQAGRVHRLVRHRRHVRFRGSISSLRRISTHRPTHSLQMNTAGPGMSFATSAWLFPQKEQSNSPCLCVMIPAFLSPLPGVSIKRAACRTPCAPGRSLACLPIVEGRVPRPNRRDACDLLPVAGDDDLFVTHEDLLRFASRRGLVGCEVVRSPARTSKLSRAPGAAGSALRIQQTPSGLRNRSAQFPGGLDPFADHHLGIRERLLVGSTVCRTARQLWYLGNIGLILGAPVDDDLLPCLLNCQLLWSSAMRGTGGR